MTEQEYDGPTDDEVADAIRIGRWAAKPWPSIDSNDVVSTLHLWLMENGNHVLRYRGEGLHGRNKLRKALQNHAQRWCSQEYRKTGEGLAAHNESVYSLDEIKAALEIICGQENWAIQTQDQEEYEIVLATLADVSAAFHGLSAKEREVLTLRYGSGLNYRLIAGVLAVTVDIARGRHLRGMKKLGLKLVGEGANWHRSPGLAADGDEAAYLAVR